MNVHEILPTTGELLIGVSQKEVAIRQDRGKDTPPGHWQIRFPRRMLLPVLEAIFSELDLIDLCEISESLSAFEQLRREYLRDEEDEK